MEKLGPPLPRFVCSNIQEREAILLHNQGSSILVALTILHCPLLTSISWSETSLLRSGSMQPYLLKVFFFFFFLLLLIIPFSWIKSLLPPWCLGSTGTRELEETLESPIHCFQQTEVHYFIYHVLLSHDQMTLVQSLPFLSEETEVLRGWVALWCKSALTPWLFSISQTTGVRWNNRHSQHN